MEFRGVGQRDIGDMEAFASVENDEVGAGVDDTAGLGFGRLAGGALGPGPPERAIAVDRAGPRVMATSWRFLPVMRG
jgi:hypothetical protein